MSPRRPPEDPATAPDRAPVTLDTQRRDERALALRVAGVPMPDIAAKFAWTDEEAHRAVERALQRATVERNPEGVTHQRNLTQQRLDALLAGMWATATDDGDPILQATAAKTVLGIIDRQSALYGTNAPKESIVTHAVDTATIAATMERLFSARAGVVEAEVVPALPGPPEDPVVEGEIIEDGDGAGA